MCLSFSLLYKYDSAPQGIEGEIGESRTKHHALTKQILLKKVRCVVCNAIDVLNLYSGWDDEARADIQSFGTGSHLRVPTNQYLRKSSTVLFLLQQVPMQIKFILPHSEN